MTEPLVPQPIAAMAHENTNENTQEESLRLAEAFRIFNRASEELSTAYTGLQAQVAELTTELAAANGALRQQYQEKAALTERLSLLLSALPAGVMVLDASSQIIEANPAARQMLDGLGVLVGENWTTRVSRRLMSCDTPGEYRVGAEGVGAGNAESAASRRLAVAVTALDSAGGRIVLLNDITEAHRLKTQSERNQRLAAMGEMAAQLAHQLRTPLAAALLYTANLENPDIATESRITIAQKAVARLKHLEKLIQEMLLFARGEVLGREAIDVTELLRELQHTIEPLARARHVTLEVQMQEEPLPPLQGNRKAIVGALANLLENALHALSTPEQTKPGIVVLQAHCEYGQLLLRVRDNGPGMAPELVTRLFEPFFTTRAEGTGLGLAIARGVARAHNGNIEVNSTPGVGTEFVVSLPLQSGQGEESET